MTFDQLLEGFKDRQSNGKNDSWADMVEEEEDQNRGKKKESPRQQENLSKKPKRRLFPLLVTNS